MLILKLDLPDLNIDVLIGFGICKFFHFIFYVKYGIITTTIEQHKKQIL